MPTTQIQIQQLNQIKQTLSKLTLLVNEYELQLNIKKPLKRLSKKQLRDIEIQKQKHKFLSHSKIP